MTHLAGRPGTKSTDCWRTAVSNCGNSNAGTTATATHAPITSVLWPHGEVCQPRQAPTVIAVFA
jgi:hypothetical protein